MPKHPRQPEAFETIDPTSLATVGGGAGRQPSSETASDSGNYDASVMTALSGILDSINSLGNQGQGGYNAQEMMLFMMMMQQRSSAVQVAPAQTLPAIYSGGQRIF